MRERRVEIRMSQDEYDSLKQSAAKDPDSAFHRSNGHSVSSYIRKCIFRARDPTADIVKEYRELNYQIRKIGVNINQAVKKINADIWSQKDIDQLINNLGRVEAILVEIKELFRAYHLSYLEEGDQDGSDKADAH